MKQRVILGVLLLCMLTIITQCAFNQQPEKFGPEEGLIDVQTPKMNGAKRTTNQYTLASRKRIHRRSSLYQMMPSFMTCLPVALNPISMATC